MGFRLFYYSRSRVHKWSASQQQRWSLFPSGKKELILFRKEQLSSRPHLVQTGRYHGVTCTVPVAALALRAGAWRYRVQLGRGHHGTGMQAATEVTPRPTCSVGSHPTWGDFVRKGARVELPR